MGGKQLGFGDYEQSTAKKQTKREKFLSEMDQVVPWQAPLVPSCVAMGMNANALVGSFSLCRQTIKQMCADHKRK
jgi:hypothetical protein